MHCYLPDPLQGLSERALGSALELLKPLSTATLLLCLHWSWSCFLTRLHTDWEEKWGRDRKQDLVKERERGPHKHMKRAGTVVYICAKVTCLPSPVSVCWWFLCLSSYRFLKEAITNSFSSWSLLGRALWNTQIQNFKLSFLLEFWQINHMWGKVWHKNSVQLWREH